MTILATLDRPRRAAGRGTPRRAVVAAVVAVVVGAFTPAQVAARDPRWLTVSGTGSSYVDVVINTTTEFNYDDSIITGDGRYVGLIVRSATGRPSGSVISVPELDGEVARPYPAFLNVGMPGPVRLEPGEYRFHLLADGAARIRIPIDRGSSLRVVVPPHQTFFSTLHTQALSRDAGGSRQATLAYRVPAGHGLQHEVIGRVPLMPSPAETTVYSCLVPVPGTCGNAFVRGSAYGNPISPVRPLEAGCGGPRSFFRPEAVLEARVEVTFGQPRGATVTLGVLSYELPRRSRG